MGLLEGLDEKRIRRLTVAGILATDMALHGTVVKEMQDFSATTEAKREARITTLFRGLVHAADGVRESPSGPLVGRLCSKVHQKPS